MKLGYEEDDGGDVLVGDDHNDVDKRGRMMENPVRIVSIPLLLEAKSGDQPVFGRKRRPLKVVIAGMNSGVGERLLEIVFLEMCKCKGRRMTLSDDQPF